MTFQWVRTFPLILRMNFSVTRAFEPKFIGPTEFQKPTSELKTDYIYLRLNFIATFSIKGHMTLLSSFHPTNWQGTIYQI